MARHFVRLKLTLLASAFRRGWQWALGLVISIVVGVPAAIAGFVTLWFGGRTPALAEAAVILGFGAVALGWILFPLLLFGLDETLDPVRLRLLPLSRRQLVTGLMAASAVGVGPLATLIVLSGAIPGYAPASPGALLVVVAVAAQFVLCLLLARAITSALANRLRSRRGRDMATMMGAGVGLAIALLAQIPNALSFLVDSTQQAEQVLSQIVTVAGLLPLAWPAQAVLAARGGQPALAIGWLVSTAAVLVLLARWWAASLEKSLTTAPPTSETSHDVSLIPARVRILPHNRLGGTLAQHLWYMARVPQLRIQWFSLPLFAVVICVAVAFVDVLQRPEAVMLPALLAGLPNNTTLNVFGGDGPSVKWLVAAGGVGRSDLAGKTIAQGLVMLAVTVPAVIVVTALTGGWAYLPVAAGVAVLLAGLTQGVGAVVSVVAPFPLPDQPTNPFATNTGAGCFAALMQVVALAMVGIVGAVPAVGLFLAYLWQRPLLPIAALFAAVYGLALWAAGLHLAARVATDRGPELIAALTKD